MSPLGRIRYLGKVFITCTGYLQMQFYPSCCKDNSMLLAWSCFHIHLQVCSYHPPTPAVFNKVKKCVALEGVSRGPTLGAFWPFKTNFLPFYDRFAYFMPVSSWKLIYCAKVLIIPAAKWFSNWGAICSLKLWHLFESFSLCGHIIHS